MLQSCRKTMEVHSSQKPLATDSFSYSWLTNSTPSFDHLIESLAPSSFTNYNDSEFMSFDKDFDFNVVLPHSKSCSESLIHADEIFSGGCIMPVYSNHGNSIAISVPETPVSSITEVNQRKRHRFSMKNLNRVLKRSFLIFSKLGCSREDVRVDDLSRKVKEIRSRNNSNQPSPDRSAGAVAGANNGRAYGYDDCTGEIKRKNKKNEAYKNLREVRSCNNSPWASPPQSMDPWRNHVECSIDDAILHCKRSFASN